MKKALTIARTAGEAPVTPEEASRACACASEGDPVTEINATDVVSAYVDAVNGLFSVIRFGVMITVKDMSLARETHQGGCCQTGETLKGWLAANAPDVNYKTAMRMKGTGEAVAAGMGVDAGLLLRALNPEPTEICCQEEAALRDRLAEIVHGRSERSLVLWLKGGAPTPAEKPGEEEGTGRAEERALDAARRFARCAADALKCLDGRKRRVIGRDVALALREALGLKGLAWLAKVLEEAEA